MRVVESSSGPLFVYVPGGFPMHSGGRSTVKVECDALSSEEWDGLARLALERGLIQPHRHIVRVPRGGNAFGDAIERLGLASTVGDARLVVDDVLTTGASMIEVMRPGDYGLVAFARGPLPRGVFAVWSLGLRKD